MKTVHPVPNLCSMCVQWLKKIKVCIDRMGIRMGKDFGIMFGDSVYDELLLKDSRLDQP